MSLVALGCCGTHARSCSVPSTWEGRPLFPENLLRFTFHFQDRSFSAEVQENETNKRKKNLCVSLPTS